jgi:hypothetical protein
VSYKKSLYEFDTTNFVENASIIQHVNRSITTLVVTGSNINDETIRMALTLHGIKHYPSTNRFSELMSLSYTNSEGKGISAMPSTRFQGDEKITSQNITADYTLDFRELIGSFNVNIDERIFKNKATGSINAKF